MGTIYKNSIPYSEWDPAVLSHWCLSLLTICEQLLKVTGQIISCIIRKLVVLDSLLCEASSSIINLGEARAYERRDQTGYHFGRRDGNEI